MDDYLSMSRRHADKDNASEPPNIREAPFTRLERTFSQMDSIEGGDPEIGEITKGHTQRLFFYTYHNFIA